MGGSEHSKVFMFDGDDPEMRSASEQARATFRYFWREIAWERRRIVPALDLAAVKAPFSDGEEAAPVEGQPQVEQMWLGDVDFDGRRISGTLLNAPNWLTSVKEGDTARFRLGEITDWMYAIEGKVYGAYTVNLLRSRMGARERKDHDEAWGMDFGDPKKIRIVPQKKSWFGSKAELEEHPMSEAMAPTVPETLASHPSILTDKDDKGWTILHHDALAGSLPTVMALVKAGADVNAIGTNGATPLRLAKVLGWEKVAAYLAESGASQ
jgi:uncharacterized protein YegJ (DUF2314 family)